jgi:hypothetical protein
MGPNFRAPAQQTSQAVIEVAHGAADLLLQRRPPQRWISCAWMSGLGNFLLDAATGSPGQVKGDVATLEAIWVRAS